MRDILIRLREHRGKILLALIAMVILGRFLWSGIGGGALSRFWDGTYTRRWSESVALPDGREILVRRMVKVRESNSWAGDAFSAVELEATLKFKGALSDLPEWSEPLTAQVLYWDVTRSEWVIVANVSYCDSDRVEPRLLFLEGRPATNYFEFRLRNGAWVSVPVSRMSLGQPTNLLIEYEKVGLLRVTVETKHRLYRNPDFPKEWLTIVRDPKLCTRSDVAEPIWRFEDAVLAKLDQMNASEVERERVGQLFAGTRLVYLNSYHDHTAGTKDADSDTVQIVTDGRLNEGKPGVTEDGQMIYNQPASPDLLLDSYLRRLRAAGLERFVP